MTKISLFLSLITFFTLNAFANTEGLTAQQIQQTIQKYMGNVLNCYDLEIKKNPELNAGRVVLSFDVELDGKILNSAVTKTTLHHKKVEACIVENSRTWIFPKPTGKKPVQVKYPFEFKKSK